MAYNTEFITESFIETENVGKRLASVLNGKHVVCFYGDLGL